MRCRNKDSTFQVKTREFDGLNELASSIEGQIDDLKSKNLDLSSITILVAEKYLLKEIQTRVNYPILEVTPEKLSKNNYLSISTIHSFKGLENDFIILAGFKNYNSSNKKLMSLLFVAYTRARVGLSVLLNKDDYTRLLSETLTF